MTNNKNTPAFPFTIHNVMGGSTTALGLTKREWFAGVALQGMLPTVKMGSESNIDGMAKVVSGLAFKLADAMLAEGEK